MSPSLIVNIWSGDRKRKHVCLFKESEDIVDKVKAKFGIATEDVALVLERDGSVVDPDFEMLSHLSAAKETLMVLGEGQTWTSSVLEPQAGSSQQAADTAKSGSTTQDSAECPSAPRDLPVMLSQTGSPFADVTAFKQFLASHPKAKKVVADLESGSITSRTRQDIVSLGMHKLISMFGNYPGKMNIIRASFVMGELLGMPANVFYDPKAYDGFLPRFLQNYRRVLTEEEKVFSWAKKRKRSEPFPLSASSAGSSDMIEHEADGSSHQCPRRVNDCQLCLGKDSEAERDRLKLLSVQRFDDMKSAALATFCQRRRWVGVDKPLLVDILREYPKFQSTPQLLDLEFATLVPDAADFLVELPSLLEQLWKYAGHSTSPAVREAAIAAIAVNLDWKTWYALKALFLLLRSSGKKKISGVEAMQSLCRVVPIGSSLETVAEQLNSYSPILLIQGEIGGVVASVKVASETKLIEAGSSIAEGVDRLFKTFWVFNMVYPDKCVNILKFLECKTYNIWEKKNIPATVRELCSYLDKYV